MSGRLAKVENLAHVHVRYIYCVPERKGTGESAAITKNVFVIFKILFLI